MPYWPRRKQPWPKRGRRQRHPQRQNTAPCRQFLNGETQTRTGDTTIFRDPEEASSAPKVPANRRVSDRAGRCTSLRIPAVPSAFRTSQGGRGPKRGAGPPGSANAGIVGPHEAAGLASQAQPHKLAHCQTKAATALPRVLPIVQGESLGGAPRSARNGPRGRERGCPHDGLLREFNFGRSIGTSTSVKAAGPWFPGLACQ